MSIEQYVQAAVAALPWGSEHVRFYRDGGVQGADGEALIRDVLAWAARTGLLRTAPDGPPMWEEAQATAVALADASDHPRFTHAAGWRQLLESRDLVTMALSRAREAACGPQEVQRVEQLAARLMAWHRREQGL